MRRFRGQKTGTDNRYDMCVTERITTIRENPGAGILAWVSPLSGGSGQLRPEHSKEVGLIARKAWVGCAGQAGAGAEEARRRGGLSGR